MFSFRFGTSHVRRNLSFCSVRLRCHSSLTSKYAKEQSFLEMNLAQNLGWLLSYKATQKMLTLMILVVHNHKAAMPWVFYRLRLNFLQTKSSKNLKKKISSEFLKGE